MFYLELLIILATTIGRKIVRVGVGGKKLTWSVLLTFTASCARLQLKRRRHRWYQELECAISLRFT